MEGEDIAEYGHLTSSITSFGINSKRIVISSVTYGSNTITSKACIEWAARKVVTQ